jgi:hypothetical protein
MKILMEAAKEAGNAVLLNDSTDGVSYEVKDNFDQTCRYLTGDSNYLSLPDPNHNAKNGRQQLLTGGGRPQAIIGRYCFDPYLLKACGGAGKELIRVNDFALDALVLKLASSKVARSLFLYDTADFGNKMVSSDTILQDI